MSHVAVAVAIVAVAGRRRTRRATQATEGIRKGQPGYPGSRRQAAGGKKGKSRDLPRSAARICGGYCVELATTIGYSVLGAVAVAAAAAVGVGAVGGVDVDGDLFTQHGSLIIAID